ncbi:MAG: TolC family protein [Candidatus Ornithomonoglobus sp.]
MLENNLEIKAAQENITSCELKQKADEKFRKRVNDSYERVSMAPGIDDFETFLLTSGYAEYADAVQTTVAKRNLAEIKYQEEMKLTNKFYSCLNADKKITVAQDALNNANENKRHADDKLAQGMIGAIEANSFGLAVISAQNDLDDAVRERDYMYAELKQLMGYPADEKIMLTGAFERQPMNSKPLAEALAGMDKTANKMNLDASLEVQEKLLAKYRSLYTTSMYEYQSQKYAYAQAEAEYNDNVGALRLGITEAYNTMVSTYGKLDYIDKAIEVKEQQASAKKTSYELGLSTATEYITDVQELDALRLQRVDAEIGAYLASQAYEMLYHPASDAQ